MKVHENHRAAVLVDEDCVLTVKTKSFFTLGQNAVVTTNTRQGYQARPRSYLIGRNTPSGFELEWTQGKGRTFGRREARREERKLGSREGRSP